MSFWEIIYNSNNFKYDKKYLISLPTVMPIQKMNICAAEVFVPKVMTTMIMTIITHRIPEDAEGR